MLELRNVNKQFKDNKVLNDINLSIEQGEIVTLLGPSGCGKSTLLSILANLETKSSGDIKFSKDDIKLGYMLQKDSLFPWLNILDNCLLGLKLKDKVSMEDKAYVLKLLDTYGLSEFIDKFPRSLSGGMRQRVG